MKKKLCVLIAGQMRTNILSGEELTTKDITDYMNLNIFNDYMKDNFNYDVFIASDSIDIERTKEFIGDNIKNICLSKLLFLRSNALFGSAPPPANFKSAFFKFETTTPPVA